MNENLKFITETIDVLFVINAEYIKKNYPRNTDPNKAQKVDHNSNHLIVYNPREIVSVQGTADLSLKTKIADDFCFRATTIQQNCEESKVLMYKVEHGGGDIIFTPFGQYYSKIKAAHPNTDSNNYLPPVFKEENSGYYGNKIRYEGTEDVFVYFALYILNDRFDSHELYGYYYWDPKFTIEFIK
ncbi:AidA/PixA family protein [uncultured Flavobacterium sp.]|uniref:AidA/PixA family protein n=1 Tax=uncultured Flavobacterium sp. TaxID=165435 RepID=UPI003081FDF1